MLSEALAMLEPSAAAPHAPELAGRLEDEDVLGCPIHTAGRSSVSQFMGVSIGRSSRLDGQILADLAD